MDVGRLRNALLGLHEAVDAQEPYSMSFELYVLVRCIILGLVVVFFEPRKLWEVPRST